MLTLKTLAQDRNFTANVALGALRKVFQAQTTRFWMHNKLTSTVTCPTRAAVAIVTLAHATSITVAIVDGAKVVSNLVGNY